LCYWITTNINLNYLKPVVTFEILDKTALKQFDDPAAEQLHKYYPKLFIIIYERDLIAVEFESFKVSELVFIRIAVAHY
jgi:hypothetical protein